MGSNRFGNILQITTWGESHGKAIGVVIDGCPPNIPLSPQEIDADLERRRPGRDPLTSPRKEPDRVEILSGVFEGKTTGAPISLLIWNRDAASSQYDAIKNLYRPGHANYTYLKKYGIFDYRGGGRASARETACRVAAGAVAKKIIPGISIKASVVAVGGFLSQEEIQAAIERAMENGDSLGGVVECVVEGAPAGLGDPVYEKLEANLAKAMLTIPATKGFEIGEGFAAARMTGSTHNDSFTTQDGEVTPATNKAGGLLGGITTGAPITFRVAFKPTSSIKKEQKTATLRGTETTFALSAAARHDPCVAMRAPPIVEAMTALTLADALLMQNACRVDLIEHYAARLDPVL